MNTLDLMEQSMERAEFDTFNALMAYCHKEFQMEQYCIQEGVKDSMNAWLDDKKEGKNAFVRGLDWVVKALPRLIRMIVRAIKNFFSNLKIKKTKEKIKQADAALKKHGPFRKLTKEEMKKIVSRNEKWQKLNTEKLYDVIITGKFMVYGLYKELPNDLKTITESISQIQSMLGDNPTKMNGKDMTVVKKMCDQLKNDCKSINSKIGDNKTELKMTGDEFLKILDDFKGWSDQLLLLCNRCQSMINALSTKNRTNVRNVDDGENSKLIDKKYKITQYEYELYPEIGYTETFKEYTEAMRFVYAVFLEVEKLIDTAESHSEFLLDFMNIESLGTFNPSTEDIYDDAKEKGLDDKIYEIKTVYSQDVVPEPVRMGKMKVKGNFRVKNQ